MCAIDSLSPLSATLKPASDLRQRAVLFKHIDWNKLWELLPKETQELRHAAKAKNGNGFNVKLVSIASRIQVIQQAMHMTDMARASWQEE